MPAERGRPAAGNGVLEAQLEVARARLAWSTFEASRIGQEAGAARAAGDEGSALELEVRSAELRLLGARCADRVARLRVQIGITTGDRGAGPGGARAAGGAAAGGDRVEERAGLYISLDEVRRRLQVRWTDARDICERHGLAVIDGRGRRRILRARFDAFLRDEREQTPVQEPASRARRESRPTPGILRSKPGLLSRPVP